MPTSVWFTMCGLHILYTVVIAPSKLTLHTHTHTHTAVHVILVTDMVVLLTERDQRYHLASLLDHKVKSGYVSAVTAGYAYW